MFSSTMITSLCILTNYIFSFEEEPKIQKEVSSIQKSKFLNYCLVYTFNTNCKTKH